MIRGRYYSFFDRDIPQNIEDVYYQPFHNGIAILNGKIRYKRKTVRTLRWVMGLSFLAAVGLCVGSVYETSQINKSIFLVACYCLLVVSVFSCGAWIDSTRTLSLTNEEAAEVNLTVAEIMGQMTRNQMPYNQEIYLEFTHGIQNALPYFHPHFVDEVRSWQDQLTVVLRNKIRIRDHLGRVVRELGLFRRPPEDSTHEMLIPVSSYLNLDL